MKKNVPIIKKNIPIILLAAAAAVLWIIVLVLKAGAQGTPGEITVVAAPEQMESTQPPNLVRSEYQPVIPDGTNIASTAKIEANGNTGGFVVKKAIDGDTAGASYWEGRANSYPNILTAAFEETQTLHAIRLCLCPDLIWGARTQTFSVEISEDGENFTELFPSTVYEFDPEKGNELVIETDAFSCKAIQFVFTDNTGANAAQVAELELYSE